MILKIIAGIVAVLGLFLTYVALKPSHFEISREITINASAAKIFPYVNNRTLANSWNPWLKEDPDAKLSVSGPETGVGSKTSWADGKKTGTGSATVTESIPNERVNVKLEYQKPFVMTQDAAYLLRSTGGQTTIVWKVEGENSFLGRVMCTFMNMDKTVGDVFAKGLADLKNIVEKSN